MPKPIPMNNLGSMFENQFHQIALFTDNPIAAVEHWRGLGHTEWLTDRAALVGQIWTGGHWVHSNVEAEMWFNYDIMPMEVEFLKYHSGTHRHSHADTTYGPFISHMSVYVEDVLMAIEDLRPKLGMPYHRFVTQNHTNPGVIGQKRFIEAIFDTKYNLGYDTKLIQKVPWDYDDSSYLDDAIWNRHLPRASIL